MRDHPEHSADGTAHSGAEEVTADAVRERVAALLARLSGGDGGALVLRSDPGLGAGALLEEAAAGLPDGVVLRARGTEEEASLPYSGLHALLARPDVRPAAAAPTEPPTALHQALETLVAAGRPVLICVDDAQLLDRLSQRALGFAARRLGPGRPVGLLVRLPHRSGADRHFAGLPETELTPLPPARAAELLDGLLPGTADPAVRETLLHHAQGSPGLLAALAAGLTTARLTGAEPLPGPLPAAGPRYRAAAARLRALSPPLRDLLLLAAAQSAMDGPGGRLAVDAETLTRAATGAVPRAAAVLAAAEADGLLSVDGDAVRLPGALLTHTAYAGAPPARRREAHRLLARALADPEDPLPALRHRAAAVARRTAPAVAARLARAAQDAAAARHPAAARAEALERAAALTAQPDAEAAWLTAAAELSWDAGRPRHAAALLERAAALPAHDVLRGRATLVAGSLQRRAGVISDARETLLQAARLLGSHDPQGARDALRGAVEASWVLGARCPGERTPAARVRLADDFTAGVSTVMTGELADAAPRLRRAVAAAERTEDPAGLRRGATAALLLGESATAVALATRALAAVRLRGPAALEPHLLELLAYGELRTGRHTRARAHAQQGLLAAARTGQPNVAAHHHAVLAMAASVDGDPVLCDRHAAAAGADAGRNALGAAATFAEWARGRCDLALGRPVQAAARLERLVRTGPGQGHFALRTLALPCYVEAAVLSGQGERARPALTVLARWASATADPQGPALLARCRALLAGPAAAGALFAEALTAHGAAENAFERARTQLLHGMALRRHRRPGDAREVLYDAVIGFEQCGAAAWADRTRAELRATGGQGRETAAGPRPAAGPDLLPELTPQQLRIACYVAEGATNREVAMRLSVSPRTVDHHLRNVFSTLGIRSRTELALLLTSAQAAAG